MASVRSRGPSYLARIERRADSLRHDSNFTDHLKSRQRNWNAAFPEFAVHGSGNVPEHIPAVGSLPIPRAVDLALDRQKSGELSADATFVTNQAVDDWAGLAFLISGMFWPGEDFPHVLGNWHHPAMPFVALCLMYDPVGVDAANVWSHALRPSRFGYDPRHPESEPLVVMRLASGSTTFEALHRAKQEERGLSHAEIVEVLDIARREGWKAREAARDGFDPDDPDAGFWFVPIIPGLRQKDIREAQRGIVERADKMSGGVDFAHKRIRECLAAGQNQAQTALRLGVSKGTVKNAARGR